MYIFLILFELTSILIPIYAERKNSLNISISLFSLGYASLDYNGNKDDNKIEISKERYLKLSRNIQCMVGITLLVITALMYLYKIDEFLAAVIISPVGFIGCLITWCNLKKYKVCS